MTRTNHPLDDQMGRNDPPNRYPSWVPWVLGLLAVAVIGLVLFFAHGGDADIDVDPGDVDVELPDADVDVDAPDVDVELPDADVDVDVDPGSVDVDEADVEADADAEGG